MARQLNFNDGFTSSSAPTIGPTTASSLEAFANDAAYVSFKGSAAAAGDAYFNTTDLTIKVHDGTAWRWLRATTVGPAKFTLVDGQLAAANITGLLLDGTKYRKAVIHYAVYRDNLTTELCEDGRFLCTFKDRANAWNGEQTSDSADDSGCTFSITSAGQVQYVTTALGGTYNAAKSYVSYWVEILAI
jgi:hypothetical protein